MRRVARLTVYQGRHGGWYWRLRSPNGRIIAGGGEGYTRRRNCLRAVRTVHQALAVCWLEVEPPQ